MTCRAELSEKSELGKSVSENSFFRVRAVTCRLYSSCDTFDAGELRRAPLPCKAAVAL